MKKQYHGIFVYLIVGVLIVGLVVWAERNPSKGLARLERILSLLEADHLLLWKNRPNLNTTFEGTTVITDQNGFRLRAKGTQAEGTNKVIVCLGASPTFGYGVEARQAYPALVERSIHKKYPGFRVINAGEIGFSSFQGLRLFKKYLDTWNPKLVTVSYVVNDVDRLRFYFSNGKADNQTNPPSEFRISIMNALNQFPLTAALIRFKRRLLFKLFSNASRRPQYEMTHVRVMPGDYEKNLKAFIKLCRARNIPLLFIEMPFRLPIVVPDLNPAYVSELKRADKLIKAGNYKDAKPIVDSVMQRDRYYSLAYYLRGRILEHQGDKTAAKRAYKEAIKHVIHDCARDAREYNKVMEMVASQTKIPIVDPAKLLGDVKANMKYFVPGDYIHPNPLGHRKIGVCVADAIMNILSGNTNYFFKSCK